MQAQEAIVWTVEWTSGSQFDFQRQMVNNCCSCSRNCYSCICLLAAYDCSSSTSSHGSSLLLSFLLPKMLQRVVSARAAGNCQLVVPRWCRTRVFAAMLQCQTITGQFDAASSRTQLSTFLGEQSIQALPYYEVRFTAQLVTLQCGQFAKIENGRHRAMSTLCRSSVCNNHPVSVKLLHYCNKTSKLLFLQQF